MPISNLPAALQPAVQQGFLSKEFLHGLKSRLAYRQIADREDIAIGIGETVTKTRGGLKKAVTTPLAPSTNTNLDNGLVSSDQAIEQYTLGMNMYGDTIDLNTVTSRVSIIKKFLENAYLNGEQARRSLDELARNALFSYYLGGNTRVRATLGAAGPTVAVDDVRGFQNAFSAVGTLGPVTGSNTMLVTVGANAYTLIGVAVDGANVSTSPAGISGTLTFSTNVTVADGTQGLPVVAATAPLIARPQGRASAGALQATDTLSMSIILDAVARLRMNAVPTVGGAYIGYLDPVSSRELFADPDFKQLFQGVGMEASFMQGELYSPFLGVRFVPTTEAYQQAHPTIAGATIHRPIICGQGALIEGDFAGTGATDTETPNSETEWVDGIAMVTRGPLDRLNQIVAQSWYWIGGFTCPSDTTANSQVIPTANNAAYKRAVVIEHV
jgi:N4-gp56 family major capsid protein